MDWVRLFRCPPRDELQTRLDAARSPRARRSVRPETIQLALAARQIRSMGYSVGTVALATSDSTELGLIANLCQVIKRPASVGRSSNRSSVPSGHFGSSKLPRASRRRRRPTTRDAQKRSSDAYREGLALRNKHERLRRRLDDPDHPACLIAHALVLEHKAAAWHTHVPRCCRTAELDQTIARTAPARRRLQNPRRDHRGDQAQKAGAATCAIIQATRFTACLTPLNDALGKARELTPGKRVLAPRERPGHAPRCVTTAPCHPRASRDFGRRD